MTHSPLEEPCDKIIPYISCLPHLTHSRKLKPINACLLIKKMHRNAYFFELLVFVFLLLTAS